jgi:hypothetical protein
MENGKLLNAVSVAQPSQYNRVLIYHAIKQGNALYWAGLEEAVTNSRKTFPILQTDGLACAVQTLLIAASA